MGAKPWFPTEMVLKNRKDINCCNFPTQKNVSLHLIQYSIETLIFVSLVINIL